MDLLYEMCALGSWTGPLQAQLDGRLPGRPEKLSEVGIPRRHVKAN